MFFELVRAGLFPVHGEGFMVNDYSAVDWAEVYRLAEEQSVIGLVAAGMEDLNLNANLKVPQEWALQFIGQTLQIEQRNKEMNAFMGKLWRRLCDAGVDCLLVKGLGVARCYEKPLWRASGDVDLLLDTENYEKAKRVLLPIAYDIEEENKATKHMAMKIMGMVVELHGKMPFMLYKRADVVIDEVLVDAFKGGVSTLNVEGKEVKLPNSDNHVFLVFTHFLHHFFIEGVGLRQICDWSRMLFCYRDQLNLQLLEQRLNAAGLMSEWKAFASLAIAWLGLPEEVMLFYDERYRRNGERVMKLVLEAGNFGHNKDLSYRAKYKGMAYKIVSLWRRTWDFVRFTTIFPMDAPRFFVGYLTSKVKD